MGEMKVMLDSSIWISYLRIGKHTDLVNGLIDSNSLFINDVILFEIIPNIKSRSQKKIIDILNSINKYALEIDWQWIMQIQTKLKSNGINNVALNDLLISNNCIKNDISLFSSDRDFENISEISSLKLISL